jgi:predicted nucleic acid-binding Zn ribbon protein
MADDLRFPTFVYECPSCGARINAEKPLEELLEEPLGDCEKCGKPLVDIKDTGQNG